MNTKTISVADDGVARAMLMLKPHSGFPIGAITGQLLKLDVAQVRQVGQLVLNTYPTGSPERLCFREAIRRLKLQRENAKHMGLRTNVGSISGCIFPRVDHTTQTDEASKSLVGLEGPGVTAGENLTELNRAPENCTAR